MKIKVITVLCISTILFADNSNINNSGTFNNYGQITNTQTNNKYREQALEFDLKIAKLANSLTSQPKNKRQTINAVIGAAKKVNTFNVSPQVKKDKCIEYALSVKIWKVNFKIARNECNKIFTE